MKIRVLKPKEFIEMKGICQTVFFDMEREDIRGAKNTRPAKDNKTRLGVFEKGKLQSALQITPYEMRMNGKTVKMGGTGAVVTRPESRGQGHIDALMKEAFCNMNENGQIFSFLYPFSFAYYRKFGYETCYAYDKVKIPISQFREYRCEACAVPHEPEDSYAPFEKIYNEFIRERNFAIVRDTDAWKWILERDPYMDLEFTYLFYDNAGEASAYILYEAERDDDDGNRLIINECCWTSPEALHMVFGFLSRLGAEYEYVIWNAPLNIHALFPEGHDIEWKREITGMNRIVNVSSALSALKAPEKNGKVIIAVSDNFLPSNAGTYAVEWESGVLSVSKSSANPDIETSAETLAQLTAGYITPETASYKKDTIIRTPLAEFLFPKRCLYMMERY
jgi:predicted acetyltransferase